MLNTTARLKRLSLLFFFFFFLCDNGFSQGFSLDSLKKVLASDIEDSTRLSTLDFLLGNLTQGDSLSVYYNAQVEKVVIKNLLDKKVPMRLKKRYFLYLEQTYNDRASLLIYKSDPKGFHYFDIAIAIARFLKSNDDRWALINNKGFGYKKFRLYDQALACFFGALRYHESVGNNMGIAGADIGISGVYELQSDYAKAIMYNKRAVRFYEDLEKPTPMDLSELATIYHNIGYEYSALNKFEEAAIYLHKSLKIDTENNFTDKASYVYEKLGSVSLKQKNYKEALDLVNKGLLLGKSNRSKAMLLSRKGEVLYEMKNFRGAEVELNEALNYAKAVNDIQVLESGYFYLYETYKALHQSEKALRVFELFSEISKTDKKEASKNAIEQQQLKYEYEKKQFEEKLKQEKKLSDLKLENERRNTRKNMILYSLLFLAILLVISVFYIFKFFKQKNIINANKTNELKQKLLLSQMNPHFIFNSVDNIQSLIHNQQGAQAINYLTKFSKLTRQILENSTENYITLEEELSMIDNYLNIQQLLYNNKFKYTITVDKIIDPEIILLPPMLTQPFIENAIKHGLKHKPTGGEILVEFYMKEQEMFYVVTDNGLGFETENKEAIHKSLATQIVTERLQNNPSKKKIAITVKEIIENNMVKGVQTTFEIPYIYDN